MHGTRIPGFKSHGMRGRSLFPRNSFLLFWLVQLGTTSGVAIPIYLDVKRATRSSVVSHGLGHICPAHGTLQVAVFLSLCHCGACTTVIMRVLYSLLCFFTFHNSIHGFGEGHCWPPHRYPPPWAGFVPLIRGGPQ